MVALSRGRIQLAKSLSDNSPAAKARKATTYSAGGVEMMVVQDDECFRCNQRGASVAIDAWLQVRKAVIICSRKRRRVRWRLAITRQLQRSGQCGLLQAVVAHACGSAMFGQLPFVHRDHGCLMQPLLLAHSAISRSAERLHFITSREAFTCVSNAS